MTSFADGLAWSLSCLAAIFNSYDLALITLAFGSYLIRERGIALIWLVSGMGPHLRK